MCTREMLLFAPFMYFAGNILQLWQNKIATVIGGRLTPGPALPDAFQPRVCVHRSAIDAQLNWMAGDRHPPDPGRRG